MKKSDISKLIKEKAFTKLIVGLGNPGEKNIGTRHNVGFEVLDRLATNLFPNAAWQFSADFNAEIIEGEISAGQKVILAKPQTYMNDSGKAVQRILSFYNLSIDRVWVVHDDLDLPVGKIRIRNEASSGGHRGVLSIIDSLGSQAFPRFRIGIRNESLDNYTLLPEMFVLQVFEESEKATIEKSIEKTAKEIKKSLKEGIKETSL